MKLKDRTFTLNISIKVNGYFLAVTCVIMYFGMFWMMLK